MTTHFLFVYGTLRKSPYGRLHPYLKNHAIFSGRASLPGKLYRIDHYPGAVPTPARSRHRVYGEVYRLLRPQKVLALLDEYEECSDNFAEPREYRRVAETVTLMTGQRLRAWIYWFRFPIAGLNRIKSGDFLMPAFAGAGK
ncbi:MAG: gamma-glutamylcyclotransferase [Methylomonas sp.]|nr:gamma-glutamylcyclotransferase [Methylomonas sp.]